MPAVVNKTVGSFSGMSEADGITLCPRALKNPRYISLKLSLVYSFMSSTFLSAFFLKLYKVARKMSNVFARVGSFYPAVFVSDKKRCFPPAVLLTPSLAARDSLVNFRNYFCF